MASPRLVSLRAQGAPLAVTAVQRARLSAVPIAREFEAALAGSQLWPLRARRLATLQVNVGKLCNQTCRHCHVDAGPDRDEIMTRETMAACLKALAAPEIATLDITGGAPELNPHFRWFVESARALEKHVMDRCNLTVLETPSQRDLPDFLAAHQVEIVCSLPHYRRPNTDLQRGDGVFDKSIAALQRLNAAGYSQPSSGLRLVLVTNPVGVFLPANQASLEAEWKREMRRLHGIRFDALYCLANMPIARHLDWLDNHGHLAGYLQTLAASFNPAAAEGVMCRDLISVGWDGRLYDCDFNQMLDIGLSPGLPRTIAEFDPTALARREIAVGRHCFGCTAGAGSSCGGAIS